MTALMNAPGVNNISALVASGTVTMTPIATNPASLVWTCTSSLINKYVPSICRT